MLFVTPRGSRLFLITDHNLLALMSNYYNIYTCTVFPFLMFFFDFVKFGLELAPRDRNREGETHTYTHEVDPALTLSLTLGKKEIK